MKIGEAAKMTGLSVSNIRFYEKKGLLTPSRNKESQYRDFSKEDVERLKKIVVLRKAGISVEKISLLFSGHITLYDVLCSQEQELREQMKQLEGAAALCNFMKAEKDVETMDVEGCLRYMETEEQQGRSFADVFELAEDFVNYTGGMCFPYNFGLWTILGQYRMQTIWTICWWIILPVVFLVSFLLDSDHTVIPLILWTVIWLLPLIRFAVIRRKNRKSRGDEE